MRYVSRAAVLFAVIAVGVAAQPRIQPVGTYDVRQIGTVEGDFRNADVLIPVPADGPTQEISDLSTEPGSVNIVTAETGGYRLAHLHLAGAHEQASAKINYTVKCWRRVIDVSDLAKRDYDEYDTTGGIYQQFTAPGKDIQTDHVEIAGVAGALLDAHNNPFRRARAAYEYVVAHSQYVAQRAVSAAEMITSGRGNCTGYANLFVALCRAANIPARVCRGYVIGGTPPWHSWAELYLPDVGWVPTDPTNADQNPHMKDEYFASLPAKPYIVFARGSNLSVKLDGGKETLRGVWAGFARWQGDLESQFHLITRNVSPANYCILLHSSEQQRSICSGLTADQLRERAAKARENGRRPVSLSILAADGQPKYSVVWQRDESSGNWQVYPKLSAGRLRQLTASAESNQLMPVALDSCRLQDGKAIYAAVFSSDRGTDWSAAIDVTAERFRSKLNSRMRSGYIPAVITADVQGKHAKISAVFVRRHGPMAVSTGLFTQKGDLRAKLKQFRRDGTLPVTIAVTDETPPYYHLVGLKTGNRKHWKLLDGIGTAEMDAELEDAADDGLQPIAICSY